MMLQQYQDGQTKTIGGATYVRQGGQWRRQDSGQPSLTPMPGFTPPPPSPSDQRTSLTMPYEVEQERYDAASAPDRARMVRAQADKAEFEAANAQQQLQSGRDRDLASRVQGIRQEFDGLPVVKDFNLIRNAYKQIFRLAQQDSPQADIGLIFSWMKTLDSGSTVREGEFATAQNAAGVPDQVRNMYNATLKGNRLSPVQRRHMVKVAEEIYRARGEVYNEVANKYRRYLSDLGVNPREHINIATFGQTDEPGQAGDDGRPRLGPGEMIVPRGSAPEHDDDAEFESGLSAIFTDRSLSPADRLQRAKEFAASQGRNLNSDDLKKAAEAGLPVDYRSLLDAETQRRKDFLDKSAGPADAGDLVNHGATLGLSDEAAGIGTALSNIISSPFTDADFDPVMAYQSGRDAERLRLDDARRNAGGIGTVAEIGGSLLSGNVTNALAAAPNLMGRIGQGAKAGAAGGAIGGFGYGEGTNSLLSAGGGAAGGAAIGAAIPVFGQVIGNRVDGVRRLTGRDPDLPRRLVGEAIQADGNTPRAVGAMMDDARTRGSPLMLADTGDNARALLGSVGRQPGASRTITKNAVIERQNAQAERISEAVVRDLGPTANIRELGDELIERAKQNAAPLYEKAYAAPVVETPRLKWILDTPAGRGALARARTIAANEGRDPQALGFALDDNGDVILKPVEADLFGRQAAARVELTEAQKALKAARRKPGGDVDAARARLESAREEFRAADQALKSRPMAVTAATSRSYTTQTLDYVKRGLDDIIEQSRDKTTGKLVLDEAGRATNGVKNQLLAEMDRLNPAYAQARAAYAGPASMREAMEKGAKALNRSPDDIMAMMKPMGEAEKESFRLGVRKAIIDMLASRRDGGDKVAALLGTPKSRAALSRVFGGKEGFNRFVQTLRDEEVMGQTYRAVTGNSATAERLADDALTNDGGLAESMMDSALRGGQDGLWSAMIAAIQKARDVGKFGAGEAGERTRESIAALLTEADPAVLRDLVAAARRAAARQRVKGRGQSRRAVQVGRGAGNLSGMGAGALAQPYE